MPKYPAWTCLLLSLAAWPRFVALSRPLVDLTAAWVPAVDRVAGQALELGYSARAELVRHLCDVNRMIAAFWACLSVPAHLAFRPHQRSPEERKRLEADAWANAIAIDQGQRA